MWRTIRYILKTNRGVKMAAGWCTMVLAVVLLMAGWWGWRLPPEIPFYYSLPVGELQLAVKEWFWLLPGLALVFYGINWLVIGWSGGATKIFVQITSWLTMVNLMLIALAMGHIIMMAL